MRARARVCVCLRAVFIRPSWLCVGVFPGTDLSDTEPGVCIYVQLGAVFAIQEPFVCVFRSCLLQIAMGMDVLPYREVFLQLLVQNIAQECVCVCVFSCRLFSWGQR